MIKVLVVDDSALMRRVLTGILAEAGDMEAAVARDGEQALGLLHAFLPDVVTLDVTMPNMDGLACLNRIMIERPCPVIMLSSLTDEGADVTLTALQLGAVDFLPKPAGTVSLSADRLAPVLLEKIRNAARARVPLARRLSERVKMLRAVSPVGAPPRATLPADTVVIMGASTGGPPALDAVLSPLPASFPWPIVVAQHMPAAFTGPLARRLDRACALSVTEVTAPAKLQRGCVYVGRGDADLVLSTRAGGDVVVMAAPASAKYRWHPSVDRLVESALGTLDPSRLTGVLMTGMGNDGAATMAALRRAGGHTIAESEETAVVWGMPGELVRAGGAEEVLRLEHIAGKLQDWAR